MKKSDETYIQRALLLANLGKFETSPNPRVGAVIVHQGKIIGEGFHRKYGQPHAEVNAVASVHDKKLLKDATIFVTLEPCSHTGKTPPCADLLIHHHFKRVVICNKDPFDEVNGSGILKLERAGIEVETGVLEEEGRTVNQRFFTFHEKKRPYIILKWAQSADGFITDNKKEQTWITGSLSKQLVHNWRAEEAAILIGKTTALVDNPELTTREVEGKNPTRIVVDENLSIPEEALIYSKEAATIVLNVKKSKKEEHVEYIASNFRENLAQQVAKICFERNLQSLIVEGGTNILEQFIHASLWDEARIFKGQAIFKHGIAAPKINGTVVHHQHIQSDELTVLRNL